MWKQWAILWLLALQQPSPAVAQNAPVGQSDEAEVIVGWHANPTGRGTLSLLYSCLLTIFACTWTVLHLNVPGRHDGTWTRICRKAKWMLVTFLLPEFIFAKAICELRLAMKDLAEFQHLTEPEEEEMWTGKVFYKGYPDIAQVWKWQPKYSGVVRRLYPLMGLSRPTVGTVEEEGNIEMSNADDEQPATTTASTSTSDGGDVGGRRSSSNIPQEPADRSEGYTERAEQGTEGKVIADEWAPVEKTSYDGSEAGIGGSGTVTTSGKKERAVHNGVGPEEDILTSNEEGGEEMTARGSLRGENHEEEAGKEAARTSDEAVRRELSNDRDPATGPHTSSARRRRLGQPPRRSSPRRKQIIRQHWTLSHAYLANMGGLLHTHTSTDQCLGKDVEYVALLGSKLTSHYYWSNASPLRGLILSEDDIADKSKADWLLRAIAVCQVIWVILTVTARGILGLRLTQLEIATAAFSIFAVATYAANLWKPKDISQPILLHCQAKGWGRHEEYHDWTQSFVHRLIEPARLRNEAKERDFNQLPRVKNDMIWMPPEDRIPLVFYLMAASTLVFGGLHCIAWNFEFPSYVELMLWRTASVASAVIPVLSILVSIVAHYLVTDYTDKLMASWLVAKATSLAELPGQYHTLLKEPVFDEWSYDAMLVLVPRPAFGKRDFDVEPTEEAVKATKEEMRRAETLEKSRDTRHKLYLSRKPIIEFFECWEKARKGVRNPDIMDRLLMLHFYWREGYMTAEDVLEIWDDYEESYVSKRCRAAGGKCFRNLGAIFEQTPEVTGKMQRYRDKYDQVSRFLTMGSGIFYVLARLIIIVLLFTSLRAVPLGVYESTLWTRFLPSFS